jgi:hypothetical protein
MEEDKKAENEDKPKASSNEEQSEKLEIDANNEEKSIKQAAKSDGLEPSNESKKEKKPEQEQKKKKVEEKNEEAN